MRNSKNVRGGKILSLKISVSTFIKWVITFVPSNQGSWNAKYGSGPTHSADHQALHKIHTVVAFIELKSYTDSETY